MASWSLEEHALEALRALGVLELFDVVVAEFHPARRKWSGGSSASLGAGSWR